MKILGILTIDCRTPDRQIGKKVGLSGVSVKSRITKMERAGIIQNFTMKIEPPSLGYGIIYLTVPSDDMLTIETMHLLICHLLTTMIRSDGEPQFSY